MESGVVVQAKSRLEEAGIKAAMFPYLPSVVGRDEANVVLGGSSGKSSIVFFLDKLGLPYEESDLEPLTELVKAFGRKKRDVVSEDEFKRIYEDYKSVK